MKHLEYTIVIVCFLFNFTRFKVKIKTLIIPQHIRKIQKCISKTLYSLILFVVYVSIVKVIKNEKEYLLSRLLLLSKKEENSP